MTLPRKVRCRRASATSMLLLLVSCGKIADDAEKSASMDRGVTDLIYVVKIDLNYKNKTISLTRQIKCSLTTIAGGSIDQSPSIAVRTLYPKSIGTIAHDGSFIAIKTPDFCLKNRKYKSGKIISPSSRLQSWASPGPYNFFPLVIWSNSRKNPEVIEEFISPKYYSYPGRRLDIIRSSVSFPKSNDQTPELAHHEIEDNPIANDVQQIDQAKRMPKLGQGFTAYIAFPIGMSSQTDGHKPREKKSAQRLARQCVEKLQYGSPEISDLPEEYNIGYRPIRVSFGKVVLNKKDYDTDYKNNAYLIPIGPPAFQECITILSEIKSVEITKDGKYREMSKSGIIKFHRDTLIDNSPAIHTDGRHTKIYSSHDKIYNAYSIAKVHNISLDPYSGN